MKKALSIMLAFIILITSTLNTNATEKILVENNSAVPMAVKDLSNPYIYSTDVEALLTRTKYTSYPLVEYDDPIIITKEFTQSPKGIMQQFIKNYGSVTTNNKMWTNEFAATLDDLLTDDTVLYQYVSSRSDKEQIEDLLSDVSAMIGDELDGFILKSLGYPIKFTRTVFSDANKSLLKNNIEKIILLSEIGNSTTNKNLMEACQICINGCWNNTLTAIQESIIDLVAGTAAEKLLSIEVIRNQILQTTLKKSILTKIVQDFSLGSAATYVLKAVAVVKIISHVTGIDNRVKAAVTVCCANEIYLSTCKVYGDCLESARNNDSSTLKKIGFLFQFALAAKKKEYESMPKMYTSSTWKKIVDADIYLKENCEKIKDISIYNYKKETLNKLVPTLTNESLIIQKKATVKLSVKGSYYLGTPKYKSSNSSIASVDSKGNVTGKKGGKVTITCTVKQLSKTYNLICKVYVKDYKKEVLRAYNKYLQKKRSITCSGVSTQMSIDSFAVLDIDDDGIPELIITDKNYCKDQRFGRHTHFVVLIYDGNVRVLTGTGTIKPYMKSFYYSRSEKELAFKSDIGSWFEVTRNGFPVYVSYDSLEGFELYSFHSNTKKNRDKFLK